MTKKELVELLNKNFKDDEEVFADTNPFRITVDGDEGSVDICSTVTGISVSTRSLARMDVQAKVLEVINDSVKMWIAKVVGGKKSFVS
jgi:hypothetical protein